MTEFSEVTRGEILMHEALVAADNVAVMHDALGVHILELERQLEEVGTQCADVVDHID